jgi:hypothetical protein
MMCACLFRLMNPSYQHDRKIRAYTPAVPIPRRREMIATLLNIVWCNGAIILPAYSQTGTHHPFGL